MIALPKFDCLITATHRLPPSSHRRESYLGQNLSQSVRSAILTAPSTGRQGGVQTVPAVDFVIPSRPWLRKFTKLMTVQGRHFP